MARSSTRRRRGGTRTETARELKARLERDPSSETLAGVLSELKNFPEERDYVVPIEEQLLAAPTTGAKIRALVDRTLEVLRVMARMRMRGGRRRRSTRRSKTTRRR